MHPRNTLIPRFLSQAPGLHSSGLGRRVHEPFPSLLLTHPALPETPHDILDPALPVVRRRHARCALALLDRVRALLEVLEAALVDLGLGVRAEREVGFVVFAALDAVLGSAEYA